MNGNTVPTARQGGQNGGRPTRLHGHQYMPPFLSLPGTPQHPTANTRPDGHRNSGRDKRSAKACHDLTPCQ